jgi:hypothetical protein
MATPDETPPPRVRRRPQAATELDALLRDVRVRVVYEELPKDESDRIRVLVSRRDPEVMEWLYDTLWKLRLSGLKHFDIAARFDVHVQTVKKWWKEAQGWATRQHTSFDPGAHFAERLHKYKLAEERLTNLMLTTTDPKTTAMLATSMVRLDTNRRVWLERHKYFDLFPFGKIQGGAQRGRQEVEEFVRDLDMAFAGEDPAQDEDGMFDEDDMPLLLEDDT